MSVSPAIVLAARVAVVLFGLCGLCGLCGGVSARAEAPGSTAGGSPAAVQAGAGIRPLALLVRHQQVSTESDGVRRQVSFSERYYRYPDTVFVQRVIPEGAHDPHEHGRMGKPHRSHDLSAASRWIVRETDSAGRDVLKVRLVQHDDRVLIEVSRSDWQNIGFDGSWATAWHLLAPEQLARLSPIQRAAPAGARWYAGGQGGRRVTVLWDIEGAYPRLVEVVSGNGHYRSRTSTERIAVPSAAPWTVASRYAAKDYADMLD